MNTKVIYLGRNTSGVYLTCEGEIKLTDFGWIEACNRSKPTTAHGKTNPYPALISIQPSTIVKLTIQIEQVPQYIPGKWYLGRAKSASREGIKCYHYNGTDFCVDEDRGGSFVKRIADELILSTTPIEHPFLEGQQ